MMKLKLIYSFFVVTLFVSANQLFAQVDNSNLFQNVIIADSLEKEISFSIASQNFLRNNEYFHDMLTGYTLFGTNLSAQISYQANKNLKIQTGVFIRKDFGNSKLKTVLPLISLKYQKNGFAFLAGNLEGNFSHRLIEPLFNYERFITNYTENGLQMKFDKDKFWSDTWINWEVMQYYQSDFQEQFTGGHSSKLWLIKNKKTELILPWQGIVTHRGGQIDIDTNSIESNLNLAIGLEWHQHFIGFINQLSFQNYYTIYNKLGSNDELSKGSGFYSNLSLKTKNNFTLMLSYWKGENFVATRGGDLFQSISSPYLSKQTIQKQRELAIVRFLYQRKLLEDLYIDLRIEPYYDIKNKFIEHGESIYITYKHDFKLYNEKKGLKL